MQNRIESTPATAVTRTSTPRKRLSPWWALLLIPVIAVGGWRDAKNK